LPSKGLPARPGKVCPSEVSIAAPRSTYMVPRYR
jgi:hypothetical protein